MPGTLIEVKMLEHMKEENMKNKMANVKKAFDSKKKNSSVHWLVSNSVILIAMVVINVSLMAQSNGSSATQSVTIEVKPIAKISVVGSPTPLIVSDDITGSVSDENTKYSLVTNVDNMKIVASINDAMPAGTKLMIKLSSSKAASAGLVDLSNALTPLDVVRGIGRGSDVDQSINYTFAANDGVGDVASQSRMITLTLTN